MRFLAVFALIFFRSRQYSRSAQKSKARKTSTAAPGLAQLEKMTARFAPTPLRVDTSKLSAGRPSGAGQADRGRAASWTIFS